MIQIVLVIYLNFLIFKNTCSYDLNISLGNQWKICILIANLTGYSHIFMVNVNIELF